MAEGDVLRVNTGDELAEADVIRCGGCRCGSGRSKGCFDDGDGDTALLQLLLLPLPLPGGDPLLGGSRSGDESCEGRWDPLLRVRLMTKEIGKLCRAHIVNTICTNLTRR